MNRVLFLINLILMILFFYGSKGSSQAVTDHLEVRSAQEPFTVSIQDIYNSRSSYELIDPLPMYPSLPKMDEQTIQLLKQESHCLNKNNHLENFNLKSQEEQAKPSNNDSQKDKGLAIKKLWNWIQFHCKNQPLPTNFFESPPFMSPWGDSWVAWAHSSSHKEFQSEDWLTHKKVYTHLLEANSLSMSNTSLSELELLIQGLSPTQLQQILMGEPEVSTETYSFKLIPMSNPYRYKVSTLNNLPFYQTKTFIFSLAISAIIALALVLLLTIRLVSVKQKHQKDRELMMQTLAHELRHPVTSLQLSMEVYRNHFEDVPSEVQTEFLRMTGQIQRLFRIIHASSQYLTAKKDTTFQFNVVEIKSIYEFISELLLEYESKLTYRIEGSDSCFFSDPYWLGVCITNLIKNALIHGKAPITVNIKCTIEIFEFSVTDQGKIVMSLNDITTPFLKGKSSIGMGLGLSIVNRIIHRMGGKLQLQNHPTQFYFYVKGLKNEKNLAS